MNGVVTASYSLLALGLKLGSDQPPLPKGIHLRWMPEAAIGFPAYGYYLFRRESFSAGSWQAINLTCPIALPVNHAKYPCPTKPASMAEARQLAMNRVTYSESDLEPSFGSLYGTLINLFEEPQLNTPSGKLSQGPNDHPVVSAVPSPLEQLLLGSLQPAVAQQLGLYFIDRGVAGNEHFDYLLLADPGSSTGGALLAGMSEALAWLATTSADLEMEAEAKGLGVALLTNCQLADFPELLPQFEVSPIAYALPSRSAAPTSSARSAGSVGLGWEKKLPAEQNVTTLAEQNVTTLLFHRVFRARLTGDDTPGPEPAASDYERHASIPPLLLQEHEPNEGPAKRSPGWPPQGSTFPEKYPIYAVDPNLEEGWYSYRVEGQDIFGRRTSLGPSARWRQWKKQSSEEAPWYYQETATGEREVHPYAVRIFQKSPPPPPSRLTAVALDPRDRWLERDQAYEAWRAQAGPKLIGLRASWLWTRLQQRQAPDTREFRLYFRPGLSSETGNPQDWPRRIAIVPFHPEGTEFRVEESFLPSIDSLGRALSSSTTAFESAGIGVEIVGRACRFITGADPILDLAGVQPPLDQLWLRNQAGLEHISEIITCRADSFELKLDSAPPASFANPAEWCIGRTSRRYEVFLPAPDVGNGQPFEPSLATPLVNAQMAVSAVDDQKGTLDHPKWQPADAERYGNEGKLAAPAAVCRVLQIPPAEPELPELPERLWATPADYHGRSFTTFRIKSASAALRLHILRALDQSLFSRDWLLRECRSLLNATEARNRQFFPSDWALPRRQAAVEKLGHLVAESDYDTLPDDGWVVLARLPGNENIGLLDPGVDPDDWNAVMAALRPLRPALQVRDWRIRQTRRLLVPSDLAQFPWNAATRLEVAAQLNTVTSQGHYSTLPDLARRALAALPGNEAAFVQVTLKPLDLDGPELTDRRQPDDPAGYAPKTELRAFLDTLPGRASNAYFYRARFVDGAQNQSSLSLPGPPVYLINVNPPRTPTITALVGAERKIEIRWVANSEMDLKEYLIYRSDDPARAGDLRTMELVRQTAAVAGLRTFTWSDEVKPLRTYYYRMVAVISSGIGSAPTPAMPARAFDQSVPKAPSWVSAAWDGAGIKLRWEKPAEGTEVLMARRTDQVWLAISGWMPGDITEFHDEQAIPDATNHYRLRVRNEAGTLNTIFTETAVAP